jgi:HYR domain-containing protein
MRSAKLVFLGIALSLFAAVAFADEISSVSPTSFFVNDAEAVVDIFGSGLTGNVSTTVIFTGPGGTITADASEGSSTFLEVSVPSGVLATAGTYTIMVDAQDDTATRHIGTGSITVVERPLTSPPILGLPESVTVEATSASGAIAFYDASAINEDGNPVAVSCLPASGTNFAIGSTTVHCSATNSFGTTNGVFEVFVADTVAPTLTLPGNIFSTDPVVTWTATATDAISGSITVFCSPASGSTFLAGNTTVHCSATDSHSNTTTGSFNVFVGTVPPPSLNLPSDFTVEATGPSGASVVYSATTDADATVACTPASGSTFGLGTTNVSCTATRGPANTSGSFNVTVVDTTPPVITVPADFTVTTTGTSAIVTFTVTATDAVEPNPLVFCNPPSGSSFPIGTTTVVCTAVDSFNPTQKSFHITVSNDQPPVLTLPAPITAEATSPAGAAVTFTATALDDIDGVRPVTCNPASGSTFALGTTTVHCSASDLTGHTTNGTFTVTVVDTTPPHITSIVANPGVLWPPNHQMVAVTVQVGAIDLVDQSPVSHITGVTSNQPINGTGDGDAAPDWEITGPLTLNLRSERAQGVVRVYTITIVTTDFSGNSTTGSVDVTVGNASKSRGVGH